MGDPSLIAGHDIVGAVEHSTGAQCAKVGAGIGLGKDGGGQDFSRRDLGQPIVLLGLCATGQDQLSGNL